MDLKNLSDMEKSVSSEVYFKNPLYLLLFGFYSTLKFQLGVQLIFMFEASLTFSEVLLKKSAQFKFNKLD